MSGILVVTVRRGVVLEDVTEHIAVLATTHGMTLKGYLHDSTRFTVPVGEEQRIVDACKDDPYVWVEIPTIGALDV